MLLYKIKYKPYNTVFFFKKSHTNCYSCTGRVILTTFKIREPIVLFPYQILQNLSQKQFNLKLSNFWQIYAIFLEFFMAISRFST